MTQKPSQNSHDRDKNIQSESQNSPEKCDSKKEVKLEEVAEDQLSRREFLTYSSAAIAGVAVVGGMWPMIGSLAPADDTLALASVEVDISNIAEGQSSKVMWRGKPVFIRHRTAAEIAEAEADDNADLKDPQTDAERVQKKEWLVTIGICTHLGCIPTGNEGKYNGWFCPCHGSVYDLSGRIRQGPAPKNLEVPQYTFISDTVIKIG